MIVYFDMDGVLTCLDDLIEELRIEGEERGSAITRISAERGHNWLFENAPASPKLEEFKTLMRDLVKKGYKVEILTSLGLPRGDHPGVSGRTKGKKYWLGKFLSNELIDHVITKINMVHDCHLKGDFGGKDKVLIDDQLNNLNVFENNAGKGYLYKLSNHNSVLEVISRRYL